MVTKSSKLYPAVKLCHSMVSYYNPFYLDFLTDSEYDFIQLYELKKMTSEESLRYYSHISSLFSSNYNDCVRLRNFFYNERAIRFDDATLLYLSIMDKLFQSYFNSVTYSITYIFYYINFDFIYLGLPFYDCILDTCKEKEKFKIVLPSSPLSQK